MHEELEKVLVRICRRIRKLVDLVQCPECIRDFSDIRVTLMGKCAKVVGAAIARPGLSQLAEVLSCNVVAAGKDIAIGSYDGEHLAIKCQQGCPPD